mgnify:CR=1 FL=1
MQIRSIDLDVGDEVVAARHLQDVDLVVADLGAAPATTIVAAIPHQRDVATFARDPDLAGGDRSAVLLDPDAELGGEVDRARRVRNLGARLDVGVDEQRVRPGAEVVASATATGGQEPAAERHDHASAGM